MQPNNGENSDYCSKCGNPLLYPDKPCPNCNASSKFVSEQIIDNTHPYRKPIVLTLMLVGIGWVINTAGALIIVLLGLSGKTRIGSIASAYIVGNIYTNKLKDVIPRRLKIYVAVYYYVLEVLVAIPIIYIYSKGKTDGLLLIPIFGLIDVFLTYWMLGMGSNMAIKKLKKKEEQNRSTFVISSKNKSGLDDVFNNIT